MTVTIDDANDGATAEARRDELAGRLAGAVLASLDLQTVYLGDRLGLYRALEQGGAATAPELAERAGYSVVACLANGLVDQPSVGTGTVIRPSTVESIAREAGFTGFTILPVEHESFRFYRLDP